MTTKKSKLTQVLLTLLFTCTVSLAQAQGPGDPGDDPDPAIPFDGGISLLIAAGVGYAAKKGYDKRNKNKQGQTEK